MSPHSSRERSKKNFPICLSFSQKLLILNNILTVLYSFELCYLQCCFFKSFLFYITIFFGFLFCLFFCFYLYFFFWLVLFFGLFFVCSFFKFLSLSSWYALIFNDSFHYVITEGMIQHLNIRKPINIVMTAQHNLHFQMCWSHVFIIFCFCIHVLMAAFRNPHFFSLFFYSIKIRDLLCILL